MQYRKIPQTDLSISMLTLGTWVFGGDSWGETSERDSLGAIDAALEHGINMIDTAPIYGLGVSERIVGKGIRGRRDKVILATKCGLMKKGNRIDVDLSEKNILQEIDDSLKRLDTDYIDIYQCHWPDKKTPVEKTMETLCRLQSQKKIRHIGVSNFGSELLRRALSVAPVVTLQNQYSLLERAIERDPLPFCRANHVGVLTYGSLAGGILSGKYNAPTKFQKADARSFFYTYYSDEAFARVQKLLDQLKTIGRPLNQVALNWVRQQPGVTSVLIGCRHAQQVKQNVLSADWDLTPEQLTAIRQHLS